MAEEEQIQPPPSEETLHPPPAQTDDAVSGGEVMVNLEMRPVFLGNLKTGYTANDVTDIFNVPRPPPGAPEGRFGPVPVDRVDLKRGYCFVFLKDATSQAHKDMAEQFVSDINGMEVENVSMSLRAEFARGDGRIKRKEDDRRRQIQPSETLFVVNFHEDTTKREDLQMLFEPFGELVRIDMKRNYAFVQFRTVDQATRAKEVTNGGKLDQSVLTVEYVARQRGDQDRGDRRRRDDRDRRGNFDRRGQERRGNLDRYDTRYDSRGGDRGYDRDRDDRGGRDDFRGGRRDRSPLGYRGQSPGGNRGGYRGDSPGGYRGGSPGGYRRRSRSRSRSPRGYRSRSPPMRGGGGGGGRYDDRDRGGRYDDYGRRGSPPDYRDRGFERDNRDIYRRDDRGYRP